MKTIIKIRLADCDGGGYSYVICDDHNINTEYSRHNTEKQAEKALSLLSKYRGFVVDRLGSLPTIKTRYYNDYESAHKAAERLAKRYGDRANISVE